MDSKETNLNFCTPVINNMALHFKEVEKTNFEFSWTLKPGRIETKGRLSCWIEGNVPGDFQSISTVLDELKAPDIIKNVQLCLENPYIQGIGMSCLDQENTYRLYLHGRKTETQKDYYEAWRWGENERTKKFRYIFCFFSEENNNKLKKIIPPVLQIVYEKFTSMPRFRQMSGCWIRTNEQDIIDQIDVCFPWSPPAESLPGMELLLQILDIDSTGYPEFNTFPVRHVAFKTATNARHITLYTSASAKNFWPDNEKAWQHYVLSAAKAVNHHVEKEIFSALPSLPEVQTSNEIGNFYDGSIDTWKKILGPKMHYHAGAFKRDTACTDEEMEQALDDAVTSLYPLLPKGGRVYDIGCGWGGPLSMITKDLTCRVLGLTASSTQCQYIASLGFNVRLGDAEQTLPPGYFDCVLMIESLDHIVDKKRLLTLLKSFCPRLVMRVNCQDKSTASTAFGGTMHMISSDDLKNLLEETGWTIRHWKNVRTEGLPSVSVWNKRLKYIPATADKHIETLRSWSSCVLRDPVGWGANNPLIELMAEC